MRKKGGGGGGANWMDTYGDMVTLLLCFFVLLYSMSTIDEEKWKAVVMSFNPDAVFDQTEIVGGNDGPSSDAQPLEPDPDMDLDDLLQRQEEINEALNELYDKLQEYAGESGIADSVEITKGDGYVFITFRDRVFFAGDSDELTAEGIAILKDIADIFTRAKDSIDEIRIMGHTAQAHPDRPNKTLEDRRLSALRAANAAAYIQMNSEVEPQRIVCEAFGQWRGLAKNDMEANRAKNRRIEIKITGFDLMDELGDSIEQYYALTGTENPGTGDN